MIQIDETISAAVPDAALGVLTCSAVVAESSADLLADFDDTVKAMQDDYTLEKVAQNPHVAATRKAYKALGKDPLKYRNSAEAMLRRIAKGNGLYRINNAVDINNMASVASGYSLGAYDCAAIKGQIVWKRAPDGEKYKGIGKDVLNIEHLPALYDDEGVFGNPTSDSRRTMIETGGRKNLLYVIYAFDGADEVRIWLDNLAELLKKYANAEDVQIEIVD